MSTIEQTYNTIEQTRKLVTAIPGPRSLELTERRVAAVSRGVGVTMPVYCARAYGGIIEDVDGNRLIDLGSGIAVTTIGNSSPRVVEAVGHAFARRAWGFFSERRIEAAHWSELTAGMADRRIVMSPMEISEQANRRVAELRMGEILGYCLARELQPCVLSGVATRFRAVLSPRM